MSHSGFCVFEICDVRVTRFCPNQLPTRVANVPFCLTVKSDKTSVGNINDIIHSTEHLRFSGF